MAAISGHVMLTLVPPRADLSGKMLAAMAELGPHGRRTSITGPASFGRGAYLLLPEDAYDQQPLQGAGTRYLFTADVRLDNREELTAALGIDPSLAATACDADIMLRAWERWEVGALDRIVGDYAIALWDDDRRILTLARAPMALKPLFYHLGTDFVAFSSMPAGLHSLSAIPKRINMTHAAMIAAEVPPPAISTMFAGIHCLPHGHLARIGHGLHDVRPFWQLERRIQRMKSSRDYGEALREQLDRSVASRLRHHDGKVAAHLSGGRDSSAVATSAAAVLSSGPEELLSFTAAPREGFDGPVVKGMMADESPLAALTAGRHANIRHIVARSSGHDDPLHALRDLSRGHFGPLLTPGNLGWWMDINRRAAEAGAKVLLTGSNGNFTISAGGEGHLPDLLAEEGPPRWSATALRLARGSPRRWRAVANASFGSRINRRFYTGLMKMTGRWTGEGAQVLMLRQPYRGTAERLVKAEYGDARPFASYFDRRRTMLMTHDNCETLSLGHWGLDARDPTSDRRLVEFCFTLPAEQLVSGNSPHPAFDAAFASRIPRAVLTNLRRGYQSADWFEHFTKQRVAAGFEAVSRNSIVRELLDLDHVHRLMQAWPSGGWAQRPLIYTYSNELLGALSLATFIDVHFPD